ncbi:MAG: hypothetical protein KHZ01_05360 [Lachnospiraceae bacterium]|nr:hypothetical protein [Lachnospiraceae bacterium]
MKRKIIIVVMALVVLISLCSCGSGESKTKKQKVDGDITEITRKDLNDYIEGIGANFIVVGTNKSLVFSQISYDSDVIKKVETESDDLNTEIMGEYQVTHTITVDVDAFCEKENKNNLTKGDTTVITVNTTIEVIDREYAEELEASGADVIGYED